MDDAKTVKMSGLNCDTATAFAGERGAKRWSIPQFWGREPLPRLRVC